MRSICAGYILSASPRHGESNSSELRWFRPPITRKKRAVMSRERNDETEVQTTSSDPCRRRREIKRTDGIPFSCDSLCLKRVPQPRLVFIISCPSSPLAVRTLRASWIVSFSPRELSHPSHSLPALLSFALPLFRHMCFLLSFFFFICITIQASAFIAYSILACKIIYIYIRLNLVSKSKFIVPSRTLPISNMAHFTYCILI